MDVAGAIALFVNLKREYIISLSKYMKLTFHVDSWYQTRLKYDREEKSFPYFVQLNKEI